MEPVQFAGLLNELRGGSRKAVDDLTPMVYAELHSIATRLLRREREGHTLQPTALIHEAYLKLAGNSRPQWQDRAHFIGLASHVMRQILAKYARDRHAQKRGGGAARIPVDEALAAAPERPSEFMALDDALNELAGIDERQARLIELKYFGGLKGEELAEVLGVSLSTVTRDCRVAEAWLKGFLTRAA